MIPTLATEPEPVSSQDHTDTDPSAGESDTPSLHAGESFSVADLMDVDVLEESDVDQLASQSTATGFFPDNAGIFKSGNQPKATTSKKTGKKRRPSGAEPASWKDTGTGLLLISITTTTFFYLSAFGAVTAYSLLPVLIAGATGSIVAGYFSAVMLVITAGVAASLMWITESENAILVLAAVGYLVILELAIFLGTQAAQMVLGLLSMLALPVAFIGVPVLSLMALVGLGMCLTVPRQSEAFPFIAGSIGCLLATVAGWLLLVILAFVSEQKILLDTLLAWSVYGALPATILVAGAYVFFALFLRRVAVHFEDESAVSEVDECLPLLIFLYVTVFVVWLLLWLEWIGPFLVALLSFFVMGTSTIVLQRLARCVGAVRVSVRMQKGERT